MAFFQEEFKQLSQINYTPAPDVLRIAYLGTLYHWQPIELFIDAAEQFSKEKKSQVELTFIGLEYQPIQSKRVRDYLDKVGAVANYQLTPRIGRPEAIRLAFQCDALLFLVNPELPQLSAKVFDYIALQKNILVAQNGKFMTSKLPVSEELFHFCDSQEELVASLELLDKCKFEAPAFEFDKLRGYVFSRERQAEKMAELIKECL